MNRVVDGIGLKIWHILLAAMALLPADCFSNTHLNLQKSSSLIENDRLSQITLRHQQTHFSRLTSSPVVLHMARIPEIDEWTILRNGCVRGTVQSHPVIENGDVITTSSIKNPDECVEDSIVETSSGSKYKLNKANNQMKGILKKRENKKKREENKIKEDKKNAPEKIIARDSVSDSGDILNPIAASTSGDPLPLAGKSIGNGEYLLVGKPSRSTSGKSQIWSAYKADPDGNPIVQNLGKETTAIKIKLSVNTQALLRENSNYDRVTSGIFSGRFVQKLDFFPLALGKGFESNSALVIESGSEDLKQLLAKRGYRGFTGKDMREVACAVGQCVQAMHASNLVWTDLKTENFVLTGRGIRGIDLESAVRIGANPVDYSPEACPPEFAAAFMKGEAADFIVKPSYDIWSTGMLLYELSTGRPYFAGKSAGAITKTLRQEGFQVDVSDVEDEMLRDLIQTCLDSKPEKRPNISQFLVHPYFMTSGLGPFSYFWYE